MWQISYAYGFITCFVLSLILCEISRKMALRLRILDAPGGRKAHDHPTPLLGGVGIYFTIWFFVSLHLLILFLFHDRLPSASWDLVASVKQAGALVPQLVTLWLGCTLVFVTGLWDDIHPLAPLPKLISQIVASCLAVAGGSQMTLFVAIPWIGWIVTVIWFVALTNALNWLDHMNGLSAGVACIASILFFVVAQSTGQTFTAMLAAMLGGAALGFLPHNFPQARCFMGDAGAQVLGFMLAAISVVGTFYQEGFPTVVSVIAPLLILAVPLFDMAAVLFIRFHKGQSLWVGDANHFSHRLVRLGMSKTRAVLFIYLVAINIGVGATLLHDLPWSGALLLLGQSGATFCVIVILMSIAGRD